MFFLIKYSKALEEGCFRGRSADFLYMLIFGAPPALCSSPRPRRGRALLPAPAPCEASGEARPAPPDARRAPRAGGTLLTVIAPFVNIQFLGSSLTFMMVRAAAPPAGADKRPGAPWLGAAGALLSAAPARRCTCGAGGTSMSI
jgi:hypothetical protein